MTENAPNKIDYVDGLQYMDAQRSIQKHVI